MQIQLNYGLSVVISDESNFLLFIQGLQINSRDIKLKLNKFFFSIFNLPLIIPS